MRASQVFTPFHSKWCAKQTSTIMQSPFSYFFREHPEKSVGDWEQYLTCVQNPMWLQEVLDRVKQHCYAYVEEWVSDMMTVFDNALSYNTPGTTGYEYAKILKDEFIKKCIPVPCSDQAIRKIKRTALLEKLKLILENPPAAVNALSWQVPEITSSDAKLAPLSLSQRQEVEISTEWKTKFNEWNRQKPMLKDEQ